MPDLALSPQLPAHMANQVVRRQVEKSSRNPWMVWTLAIVMALSVTGYPIAGGLSQYLGLDSTYTSYPFRAIVIVLSLNAIAMAITVGNTTMGQFKLPLPVIVFMMMYLARLLWDYSFTAIPNVDRDLLYFIATVLVPTLAMGACYSHFEERATAIALLAVGTTACILIQMNQSFLYELAASVDRSTRLGFESLNPISISYAGLYTMIAAYVVGQGMRWQLRIVLTFPIIGLGFMTFLAGGSRGPMVSIAVFLLLASLVNQRARLLLVLGICIMSVLFYVFGEDLAIVQRFTAFSYDMSVWERLYIQQMSIDQAISNPVFGSAYLELSTLAYPHNILIESAMALGFLGFGIMIALQIKFLIDSYSSLKAGYFLLPFIVVVAIVNGWISGSIFGSIDFFVGGTLMWLLISGSSKTLKRQF